MVISSKFRIHRTSGLINPLNTKLNPTCHLLALLGAHHILHVSKLRVNNDGDRAVRKIGCVFKMPLCYCAEVWDVVAQNCNFACSVWV